MTVPVHGLPPLVREGLDVALVPPGLRGDRWHRVTSCEADDRTGQLIGLSGVSSLDEAEDIVGRCLLARVSDLPADLSLHDPERLVGREVEDRASGVRATIAEVMTGPANDVWVLRGDLGEALVPVIDEVVSDVPDAGVVPVTLPAGLEWDGRGADDAL